jgi:LacI family transcriptional regulator
MDDYEFGQHMFPSLTTIRVPAARIGIRAVEYLLAVLSGKPAAWSEEIDVELVERQSSGPAPRRRRQ